MFSRIYYRIQQFLGVSKSEAKGIFVLLLIILVSLLMPFVMAQFTFGSQQSSEEQYQLDSLMALMQSSFTSSTDSVVFSFDPNTVTADSLLLLNFRPKVVSHLVHYREKGGQFRYKEDMKKVYGISVSNINRLYQYILLPDSVAYFQHSIRKSPQKFQPFDINKASKEDLLPITGIGDVLATRIIKYRNLLGGYVDKEQYREVYNLSDEAIEKLKKSTYIDPKFSPQKIGVNTAGFGDLLRHPYISKALAEEIDTFRKHKGDITDPAKLYHFKAADSSAIQKLVPYLDFK